MHVSLSQLTCRLPEDLTLAGLCVAVFIISHSQEEQVNQDGAKSGHRSDQRMAVNCYTSRFPPGQ